MRYIQLTRRPPSVNHLYTQTKWGRTRHENYKAFIKACESDLGLVWYQPPKGIKFRDWAHPVPDYRGCEQGYGLVGHVAQPSNGDIGNYAKALEDTLMHLGLTPDDSLAMFSPVLLPYRDKGLGKDGIRCKIFILDYKEALAFKEIVLERIKK